MLTIAVGQLQGYFCLMLTLTLRSFVRETIKAVHHVFELLRAYGPSHRCRSERMELPPNRQSGHAQRLREHRAFSLIPQSKTQ